MSKNKSRLGVQVALGTGVVLASMLFYTTYRQTLFHPDSAQQRLTPPPVEQAMGDFSCHPFGGVIGKTWPDAGYTTDGILRQSSQCFSTLDLNHDGVLTADELKGRVLKFVRDSALKVNDAGYITLDDYMHQIHSIFLVMDADSDGRVTADELHQYPSSKGLRAAKLIDDKNVRNQQASKVLIVPFSHKETEKGAQKKSEPAPKSH